MMNIRGIVSAIIGGLLGTLTACGQKAAMPEGQLLSIEYTESGTMAGFKYEGHAEKQADGSVMLRVSSEAYGPLVEKRVGQEVLDSLRAIIEEEKMYEYKSHYEPPFEVLDGEMWTFGAQFEGEQTIFSGGSNAWPAGNGLRRIRDYLDRLKEESR